MRRLTQLFTLVRAALIPNRWERVYSRHSQSDVASAGALPQRSFFSGSKLPSVYRSGAQRRGALALIFSAILLPLAALAQSAHWDPPSGQLGFNQVSQITLFFENCEPDGPPALPQVDGLVFGRPSQSSQTSIVNFTMTRTYSLLYPVRPTKRTSMAIPAFDIKTDKGNVRVAAANYSVGDASVGNSGVSIDDVATVKLTLPKNTFWAGEVIPVTYLLDVARRYFHSPASNIEWPAAPFVAEDWSKNDLHEAIVAGDRRVVSEQSTRAYAKQPGNYTLAPASQMINLVVGSTGFGLFSQPNVEQRQLDSKPLPVTIKALPPAPADFSGAVGEFTFTSKVIPTSGGVGEPITWTIDLSGTGNWPDITGLPSRDVSQDFQVVQPKSKRTMKDGTLFDGTLSEDVVLVPSRAGTYKLAPVHFTYFDTKSGSYKTVTSDPVTVTVTANSQPVQPPANSGAPMQFSISPPPAAPALPHASPPVTPENLPRETIDQSARGFVPFKTSALWRLAVIPALGFVMLTWFTLAAFRSRENDVERLRRSARAKLVTILTDLKSADPQGTVTQLRHWQQQAAALWEIPHAAPGSPLVSKSVTAREKTAGAIWAALWTEADRAQHSKEHTLPKDWLSRAESALQAVRVPGWAPFSLLAPKNLLPFLVVLLLLQVPSPLKAEAASDAYQRGDFTTAETDWRKSIQTAPTDWAARHNLGLSLGQQDRWAEATAYWTSAFLLNSRAETTRWDLALGLQRSGMAPAELVALSRGEGRFKLARLASPGEWQLVIIGAALLVAVALIILLLQGYKRAGAWAKPTALITILFAVFLAASATLSLRSYGSLADPAAVLVWKASLLRSIPTEVDTTQKTSPLSAGSIAVVEKTFLGWSKLQFTGGQSGWARTDDLIPLYR